MSEGNWCISMVRITVSLVQDAVRNVWILALLYNLSPTFVKKKKKKKKKKKIQAEKNNKKKTLTRTSKFTVNKNKAFSLN